MPEQSPTSPRGTAWGLDLQSAHLMSVISLAVTECPTEATSGRKGVFRISVWGMHSIVV